MPHKVAQGWVTVAATVAAPEDAAMTLSEAFYSGPKLALVWENEVARSFTGGIEGLTPREVDRLLPAATGVTPGIEQAADTLEVVVSYYELDGCGGRCLWVPHVGPKGLIGVSGHWTFAPVESPAERLRRYGMDLAAELFELPRLRPAPASSPAAPPAAGSSSRPSLPLLGRDW